jgi:hypothetical protein
MDKDIVDVGLKTISVRNNAFLHPNDQPAKTKGTLELRVPTAFPGEAGCSFCLVIYTHPPTRPVLWDTCFQPITHFLLATQRFPKGSRRGMTLLDERH